MNTAEAWWLRDPANSINLATNLKNEAFIIITSQIKNEGYLLFAAIYSGELMLSGGSLVGKICGKTRSCSLMV